MHVGTKSVLFGAHCILLHGFFVAKGWSSLYGFPWDPRLWLAFFVHDVGYFGCRDVEGPEGEEHVQLGARIMGALCGATWAEFTLRHSRHWAKKHGGGVSRLCYADKVAFAITPAWLYLPMAAASGELREYMAKSRDRQAGNEQFTEDEARMLASTNRRVWLEGLQRYTLRWVAEHRDGREDLSTEASEPACAQQQQWGGAMLIDRCEIGAAGPETPASRRSSPGTNTTPRSSATKSGWPRTPSTKDATRLMADRSHAGPGGLPETERED